VRGVPPLRSTTSPHQGIFPAQGGDPRRSPSSRPGAGSRCLHTGGSCPPPLPEDPMARILVVEDSPDVHALLVETLEAAGHEVLSAHDGLAARRLLAADAPTPGPGPGPGPDGDGAPELVVLDLMLPHVAGSVLLSEIRRGGGPAVVGAAAEGAGVPQVGLLPPGPGRHRPQPFGPAGAPARVGALPPRPPPAAAAAPEPLTHGPLTLDPGTARVHLDGVEVALTATELRLLHLLLASPGQVFSRPRIYEAVWEEPFVGDDAAVKTHVSNLRTKLRA